MTTPLPLRRATQTLRRFIPLAVSIFLLCSSVPAQQPSSPPQLRRAAEAQGGALEALRSHIAGLLDQPKFSAARLGARIVEPQSGRVVFERDAEKLFTPASNMKLYTTAAVLDAFGPDFTLETSVYAARAPSRNGVLRGDLILYGRGDPNLSARFERDAAGKPNPVDEFTPADRIPAIEALADQIKARGVRLVTGSIVGDESHFAGGGPGAGWSWEDLQFYYGAEVSALTVNDNAVTFTIRPAAHAGLPPVITVQPQTAYVTIINHAMTIAAKAQGKGTRIGISRPLGSNAVEFFGSIPLGATEQVENIAVHDPARFAATLLKEALARRGVRVAGGVKRLDAVARLTRPFDEAKLIEVASVTSQPLSEMLKAVNKPSQNLHTELLLRQLGVRAVMQDEGASELDDYGRPRSAESRGLDALRRFLAKAGVNAQALSLRDGSGLARQDLISPLATTQLLTFMLTHPHAAVYRASLPIAGVDGTLSNRMRGTPAANNVRAKTGSLMYVRSLSGYVTTKRGQTLVFSLLGNNYTGAGGDVTGLYDQICALLAGVEDEL